MTGHVAIVGAGPGDPELVTLKALRRIRSADVVFYDRLIPKELLTEVREEAALIYVGKTPGGISASQDDITRMLVEQALAGRDVVRLKGGDPYLFGRGGEEAQACAEAGVPFEVVPGITSALAGPAAAGIPVTHREHGSTVAIVPAHRAGDRSLPWSALAALDTVVLLMGASRVSEICSSLVIAGRDPATPAAAVMWATTSKQREVVGTLADLPERFAEADLGSPAVIVVGDVVRCAPSAADAAHELVRLEA